MGTYKKGVSIDYGVIFGEVYKEIPAGEDKLSVVSDKCLTELQVKFRDIKKSEMARGLRWDMITRNGGYPITLAIIESHNGKSQISFSGFDPLDEGEDKMEFLGALLEEFCCRLRSEGIDIPELEKSNDRTETPKNAAQEKPNEKISQSAQINVEHDEILTPEDVSDAAQKEKAAELGITFERLNRWDREIQIKKKYHLTQAVMAARLGKSPRTIADDFRKMKEKGYFKP